MQPSLVDYAPAAGALLALVVLWWLIKRSRRPPPVKRKKHPGVRGSMAASVSRWLLAGVVLAAATGAGLYQLLGRPGLPTATAFTTAELLDLLKIGLAMVGGLGAVVALAIGYRKQQVSEAEHTITRRQDEREETKYLNERYGKAAEQLGHDSFAVRLAGVHAMIGVAEDWAVKRQACVDVLCGYLRTPYPDGDHTEREVRQTIVTALLDRAGEWSWVTIDFRFVELEDLDLATRAIRSGLSFDHAVLRGRVTNFNGVRFEDRASFAGTVFAADLTDFRHVTVGTEVDFTGATFSGQMFDFAMTNPEDTLVKLDLVEVDSCRIRWNYEDVYDIEAFAVRLKKQRNARSRWGSWRPQA